MRLTAPAHRVKQYPIAWAYLAAAVVAVLAFFSAELSLTRGLPALHSFFVEAKPARVTLEVTSIGSAHVRRGCDYTVWARGEGFGAGGEMHICEVEPSVWNSLHPGDTIVLHGYHTPYGFRYDRVTR